MRKSDIRIYALYSGSKGNAFLIALPEYSILIDAGKSAKKLTDAIVKVGETPERVQAILLTHEHTDHTKALPIFLKKYPLPVHAPATCYKRLFCMENVADALIVHPEKAEYCVKDITVKSFSTMHDSDGSVGYRLEIPCEDGIFRFGYATDLGVITKDVEEGLSACEAVVLESNHDEEMLLCGSYPEDLKYRISSRYGHLSNSDCACLASFLTLNGAKSIMLAHLSQENNLPEVAYATTLAAVGDSVNLFVADQEVAVELECRYD